MVPFVGREVDTFHHGPTLLLSESGMCHMSIVTAQDLGGRCRFASELCPSGIIVPFLSFPLHSSSVMIDFIDAYVVGFSVLLFYVFKTYFEARAVWKRYG